MQICIIIMITKYTVKHRKSTLVNYNQFTIENYVAKGALTWQ